MHAVTQVLRETDGAAKAEARTQALPRQLGRYTLFEHLARGGTADVYLARSTDGRLCAVKEVIPEIASRARFAELLVAEARLMASLRHANVVRVRGLGRSRRMPYLAMEYVDGFDLRELLRRCSRRRIPLPTRIALGIVVQLLRALEHAHGARDEAGNLLGIVHRDVSPSNLLLARDGNVKLCDFGIAVGQTMPAVPDDAVAGKAGYMSPEHARGIAVDRRADVFAAGIVCWELLSGRRMYRLVPGEPPLRAAAERVMPPLAVRGLPDEAELHAIVRRALDRDRTTRWQSGAEMMHALERWAEPKKLLAREAQLADWLEQHFGDELRARRARMLDATESDTPECPASSGIRPIRRVLPDPTRDLRKAGLRMDLARAALGGFVTALGVLWLLTALGALG
jgi:eukaryotic-like serine/threonine-protein kinase